MVLVLQKQSSLHIPAGCERKMNRTNAFKFRNRKIRFHFCCTELQKMRERKPRFMDTLHSSDNGHLSLNQMDKRI